ncbi:MAG TPA: hypothetical protein VN641_15275 [Urbifossiella sp.]|nr:hypothetical protein [Urbifossiella sp.]
MSTEEAMPVEDDPPDIGTTRGMVQDAAVRNYLFAGFAALVMVFLVMFSKNSDVGGLTLALLGAAGMLFRWPAAPSIFLLLLLWFLQFPFGLPPAYSDNRELRYGLLRVTDVLLAFSVVVYLASHFRIYGMTTQAMPVEPQFGSWRPQPIRRPATMSRGNEVVRFLYLAGAAVLAGQFLWLLTTAFEIDVAGDFPLQVADEVPRWRRGGDFALWYARMLVILGLGFFGTLLARLVFGYWRLRRLSAAQGRMMLQESDWTETRRERVRIEVWKRAKRSPTRTPGRG